MVRDLYRPDACLYSTKRGDLAWGRYQSSSSDGAKRALLSTTARSDHSTQFSFNILKCSYTEKDIQVVVFLSFFFPRTQLSPCYVEYRHENGEKISEMLFTSLLTCRICRWGVERVNGLAQRLNFECAKKKGMLFPALRRFSPSFQRAEYLCGVALPNVSCVCPVSVRRWTLHLPFLVSERGWKLVPNYSVKLLIGRYTDLSQLHLPCLLISCVKMSNPPFYMMKIKKKKKKMLKMEHQVKMSPNMCPLHIFEFKNAR